jgi:hypothetical protein
MEGVYSMMEYKFNCFLSSLAWDFTMLIAMLLPVIAIVGLVYLGFILRERRTRDAARGSDITYPLSIHKTASEQRDK